MRSMFAHPTPTPPTPHPPGEIHVTIIATGFSQSFEDNLWSGKVAAVSALRRAVPP